VLGGGTSLLARMLIVTQMALSIALLTGATMFAHSLIKLRTIQLGFQPEHVLSAELMPRPGGHTNVNLPAYYRDLLAHISGLPGVATASLSAWRPVEAMSWEEPVRSDPASTPVNANRHMITSAFFETLGMHVFEGRDIQDSDSADKPAVAVISQSLAFRLFPTSDALGHRITLGRAPNEIQASIIGVVSDANLQELRHSKPYAVYLALYQQKIAWPVLNVRTHIDPETVADGVRRMIRAQGREFALSIETVNAQIDHSFIQDRLLGYLSTFFSLVALLLASVGLYGLLSFAVARRTAEIGIRMALGAEPGAVTRMVLGESLRLVLAGTALGLAIAIPSSRLLSAFLYDPTPHDPIAIGVASGTLLAVAIAASWLPARRAAATDPMSALRSE
jgi:predicted permease